MQASHGHARSLRSFKGQNQSRGSSVVLYEDVPIFSLVADVLRCFENKPVENDSMVKCKTIQQI